MKIPQEVLDYLGQFNWFDKSKIDIDQSDGMLIYKSGMNFGRAEISEIPKTLSYFKEIQGILVFSLIVELKNLDFLRNVRYIAGGLSLRGTSIENLKGLENLEHLGGVLSIDLCRNFKSFDGLNPFVQNYDMDGIKIYPYSKIPEFLEWQKNKQIQEISKKLLEI